MTSRFGDAGSNAARRTDAGGTFRLLIGGGNPDALQGVGDNGNARREGGANGNVRRQEADNGNARREEEYNGKARVEEPDDGQPGNVRPHFAVLLRLDSSAYLMGELVFVVGAELHRLSMWKPSAPYTSGCPICANSDNDKK